MRGTPDVQSYQNTKSVWVVFVPSLTIFLEKDPPGF